jgi:hypothetical protein
VREAIVNPVRQKSAAVAGKSKAPQIDIDCMRILVRKSIPENIRRRTMQKRTEITIETERLLVVSQRRERTVLWCNGCVSSLPMLPIDAAALIAHTTPLVIFDLVKAGKLHSAMTPDGRVFICSNSLAFERP